MGEELWRRTSHDVQESYWRYINQRLLALQNPHRQHNLHVLHQHRFLHFLLTTIDNAPRRVHSLITQTLSLLFDSISSSDLQVIQKKILTLLFGEVILSFVSFTDRSLSLSLASLCLFEDRSRLLTRHNGILNPLQSARRRSHGTLLPLTF
jgi:ABC-type multidrug transport system fused ATPase/permease subunit